MPVLNPTTAQQYPLATMEEHEEAAILPFDRPRKPSKLKRRIDQVLALHTREARDNVAASVDFARAVRRGDAMLSAVEAAESSAPSEGERRFVDKRNYYLIHGAKASTPQTDDLSTEFDRLPDRLEKAACAKRRTNLMAEFLWDIENEVAQKLATCNTWRLFRHWVETGDCRLVGAITCKQDKLCPVCAHLRAGRMSTAYEKRLLWVLADEPHLREYMWTFTVLDGPDLAERLDHLRKALKICIDHRRKFRNGSSRNAWMPFCETAGGVYSIEITIGKNSGEWHPHVHIYTLCDSDIDLESVWCNYKREYVLRCPAMEQWWLSRTGDSFIVDCRPVTSDERPNALVEVLKYAAKLSALTLEQTVHAWRTTQNLQMMRGFGCLRGVPVVNDLMDELSQSDSRYIDLAFKFDGEDYKFYEGFKS